MINTRFKIKNQIKKSNDSPTAREICAVIDGFVGEDRGSPRHDLAIHHGFEIDQSVAGHKGL